MGKRHGIRPQLIARHGNHEIIGIQHDGNQSFWIIALGKHRWRLSKIHEVGQGPPPRNEIGVFANISLELSSRHPRVVIQILLDILLGEARFRDGFCEHRAHYQQRSQGPRRKPDSEAELPSLLLQNPIT